MVVAAMVALMGFKDRSAAPFGLAAVAQRRGYDPAHN
jgi:hypothetical protein